MGLSFDFGLKTDRRFRIAVVLAVILFTWGAALAGDAGVGQLANRGFEESENGAPKA